jgi:hypothetical protein
MTFKKGQRVRSETHAFPVVSQRNNVQRRLIWNYRYIHSWSGVGALYGVSRALAFQVAMNGYEPKNPILRQKSLNGNFQYAIWTLIPFHNPYSVR